MKRQVGLGIGIRSRVGGSGLGGAGSAPANWWEPTSNLHLDFVNDRYNGTAQNFATLMTGAAVRDANGLHDAGGFTFSRAGGDLLTFMQRATGTLTIVFTGFDGADSTIISPDNSNFNFLYVAGALVSEAAGMAVGGVECTLGSGLLGGKVRGCVSWDASTRRLAGNGGTAVQSGLEVPPTYAASDVIFGRSKFGDQGLGDIGATGRIREIICWNDAALQSLVTVTARSLLGAT